MKRITGRAYLGPRPFGPGQADIDRFFGRADAANVLAGWWRDNRLTFAVGHAGRGKTSLLNAGVLPLLADERLAVLPVGRLSHGVTFPIAALPSHNPYTLALLRSWAPGESASRLAGQTIHQFLRRRATDDPVLAAIDPVDELLAVTGQRLRHRQCFLHELAEALESVARLHLLIVGREEAVSLAASALGNGARYEVPRLTWQETIEAVSRPLTATGRSLGDGAAERLISDLQTSRIADATNSSRYVSDDGIDPSLLQVACAFLEDSLPADSGRVTVRDVRGYGDVDAALTAYLRTVISEVADDYDDIAAKQLCSWLRDTFITELGTKGKAYEGVTTTAGMPNAVARALEDHHILISLPESGSRWYELLNERLIQPLRELTDIQAPRTSYPDRLRMAEHAFTIGELDLAQRYADDIVRNLRDHNRRLQAEACSLLGNLAFERDKPEEAEEHYRKAMERFAAISDTSAVAYQLAAVGQTLMAQGQITTAADALHGATTRMPGDLMIRIAHAHALWQLGSPRAAAAELTVALNIDGGNIAALTARGEILADLGEARDALLDLDRVPAQDQPNIRAARGLAFTILKDRKAARRETELALSEGTQNGPALLYAARAASLDGDDLTAAELARQATVASDPPLGLPHRATARRLMERGARHPMR